MRTTLSCTVDLSRSLPNKMMNMSLWKQCDKESFRASSEATKLAPELSPEFAGIIPPRAIRFSRWAS